MKQQLGVVEMAVWLLEEKSIYQWVDLSEEMVDVEIMLEQVRIILRVDPELEARWRERKLRRLRARLGL